VASTVGEKYGRTSATVLAALAIRTLKPGGHIAFLCPTGVLFRSGGEANLRALLAENELEAVITLSKEAFQPYSQVASHVVVARKRDTSEVQPTNPVWFCNVTQDGYPAGAGRDLTDDPDPATNELPRTRELVLTSRNQSWSATLSVPAGGEVNAALLQPEDGLPGVVVQLTSGADDVSLHAAYLTSGVLTRLRDAHTALLGWLYTPFTSSDTVVIAADRAETFTWSLLIDAQEWADDLPTRWAGSSEDVAAEIAGDDARTITLHSGKDSYQFGDGHGQDVKACLLSSEGMPLSPWLPLPTGVDPSRILEDGFAETFDATAILDGNEIRCGWIVPLSSADKDVESQQEASLFIVYTPQAQLYTRNGDQAEAFALTDAGWLHVNLSNGSKVAIETTGVQVRFREGYRHQGFAIGPAPAGSSETGYSLFGVLVPRPAFAPIEDGMIRAGDFQPRRFLPEPPAPPIAHPTEVIAQIRKNQTKLSARIDGLLNMLGGASSQLEQTEQETQKIPSLFSSVLDEQQLMLWHLVESKRYPSGKPRHFAISDLIMWCQDSQLELSEDAVRQQIALFYRMGLLLKVSTEGRNRYRACTAEDILESGMNTP